ncbi:MAG: VIT domain-containing protein [Pyrinomonadaceae bacterium]
MRWFSFRLRWVLVCLFWLIAVSSAAAQTEKVSEGSLRVTGSDGKEIGLCPLKKTEVKAEVSGFIARVTVTQKFRNPFDRAIEAGYTFPLHNDAAVDNMTIRIGTRIIKGSIMDKQKAQAVYDRAKGEGKVAALLEQQRPNVFTQSITNITPGAEIEVVISYAQTLKYADDTYEFRFPMTIGQRYIPSSIDAADAARLSPKSKRRPGHTVSMDIRLDAGVPLQSIGSATHAIVSRQLTASSFEVSMQNADEIPNRDFVLKYKTAGLTFQDTVLAYKAGTDGFFTLILQPPDKVLPDDRMPKEVIFVLDTSGSMEGRPIKKAKEAMNLTLDDLRPEDTFNLITFAGETRVLFDDPIQANDENISLARKMLKDSDSGGGTEMMKAIRAALEPTDNDKGKVRIVCFMTDGHVGNEAEIIAEVQKYPNARVFAFGIGDSVNTYLLDEISREGRGEVEYVGLDDDGSAAARRFFLRIRNPFLTDITVEFQGIEANEILPRSIPDLFDAMPVTLAGRYTQGGLGKIVIRGQMQGRPYVREIAVELPDHTVENSVLRTLWARRKAADLMRRDLTGLQNNVMQQDLQADLTSLGLEFSLLTPFTSFVAVDEQVVTDGSQTQRVEVPVGERQDFVENFWARKRNATWGDPAANYSSGPGSGGGVAVSGGVSAVVEVTTGNDSLNSSSSTIGSTVQTRQIEGLPAGRSVQSLLLLAPGVTQSPATDRSATDGSISVNGLRPTSNTYTVDGIDVGSVQTSTRSSGVDNVANLPVLTAAGGTNGIIDLASANEVSITSFASVKEGRTAGARISLISKSGTNDFHGALFETFGNEFLNANEPLANGRGLARAPSRLNQFGGSFSGPIIKDKAFFFGSYEGLRHRRQGFGMSEVPDAPSRSLASPLMRTLINAFPLPNRFGSGNGFDEFAAVFADPAAHNLFGIRFDTMATERIRLTGRYNGSFSHASARGTEGYSLNNLRNLENMSNATYAQASYTATSDLIIDGRISYRRDKANQQFSLDGLGGAIPSLINSGSFDNYKLELGAWNGAITAGRRFGTTTDLVQLGGSAEWIAGSHHFSFGLDLRRYRINIDSPLIERSELYQGIAADGNAARITEIERDDPGIVSYGTFSAFAQDQWRIRRSLNVTLGLRWDVDDSPKLPGEPVYFGTTSTSMPSGLGNFAPRVAVAYELLESGNSVIRAGAGLFFDHGNEGATEPFVNSFPFVRISIARNAPIGSTPTETILPLAVFSEGLETPRTWQVFADYQQRLPFDLVMTGGYNAAFGRRLFVTRTVVGGPSFGFVRLTDNSGSSDHHAAHVHVERRFSYGFAFGGRFTFARTVDNYTRGSFGESTVSQADLRSDRGASDLDVRQTFAFYGSYGLTSIFNDGWAKRLVHGWTIFGRANVRSALPVNVTYRRVEDVGVSILRPDVLSNGILWNSSSSSSAIDRSVFAIPPSGQGTLPRNAFRGFPFTQADLGLERGFTLGSESRLRLVIEVFNVLNTTNFADPDGSLGTLYPSGDFFPNRYFGQTTGSYGGRDFSSFYLYGGGRTIQLSAKFDF